MKFDHAQLFPNGLGCRMLLVGVGSAGCKALGALVRHGIDSNDPDAPTLPDSLAIHTDVQALEASKAPRQFCIGDGFSTGGDVMKGKACAEEASDKLREMFGSYRLIFFVTGLGGGTGNGATPVFVQLAREMGAFTLVMAVMPFHFEGERKRLKADTGLATLCELSDGVVCFPNQRLFSILEQDTGMVEALAAADSFLADGLVRLWHLLNEPGVMNLDFADVAALVQHSNGTCTLASVEASGEDRIPKAVEAILTDALFDRGTIISKARAILIGIIGGPDIRLHEIERIHTEIADTCQSDVVFFSGVTMLPGMEDQISLTLLASEMWIAAPAPVDAGGGATGLVQESLQLQDAPTNEFLGTDQTKIDGENLDIPTYLRRGIKLGGL